MKESLTQKQIKFYQEYLRNKGIAVKAALFAYDTTSYKTASKLADTNLKNPRIREIIEKELNYKGITVGRIARTFAEGLNARIVAYSPETLKYNVLELPNHNVRHKFLELLLKVLGIR